MKKGTFSLGTRESAPVQVPAFMADGPEGLQLGGGDVLQLLSLSRRAETARGISVEKRQVLERMLVCTLIVDDVHECMEMF